MAPLPWGYALLPRASRFPMSLLKSGDIMSAVVWGYRGQMQPDGSQVRIKTNAMYSMVTGPSSLIYEEKLWGNTVLSMQYL